VVTATRRWLRHSRTAVRPLLFTGSTAWQARDGRRGCNLTPVTLELGGKSPTVVAPDYPVQRAATRILAGKLLNAGRPASPRTTCCCRAR